MSSTLAYTSKSDSLITHIHSTKTFSVQRRDALIKQRSTCQARLDNLRKEIRRIMNSLETGKVTGTTAVDEAFEKLARMGRAEAKLLSDITRLSSKIGA